MDAITTAVITADETGASNAKAWHTYCDSVKSLVGDEIDAMERDLLATESYLDYCWAFSPEEVSK